MKIGMLGAGYIGTLLAKRLINSGYTVELSNSRGPESLQPLIKQLGSSASAVTTDMVAKNAVVILSVKWDHIAEALRPISNNFSGILIDATNPFSDEDELLNFPFKSASEIVASNVPHAKVVKAFNSLYGKWIEETVATEKGKRVTFISGDDPHAKSVTSDILKSMGFAPVDIGDLKTGIIQQAGHPLAGLNLVQLT
jgi:predicted dinucleotide-binding enzyme